MAEWRRVLHDKSEGMWEHPAVGMWLIVAGMVLSACLLYSLPSPGIGVTLMGIAAAIMSARTKASGREKAGWMFLMFSLLLVEILAIRRDRITHDAMLTELLKQETAARREATTNFEGIGTGIKDVIQRSEQQFRKATTQASSQFDATMNRAQENLNHMTGGTTYPLVTPLFIPVQNTQNTFRLGIVAVGASPLFDVNVTLSKLPLPTTPISATDFVSGKGLPHVSTLFVAASLSPNRAELLPSVTPAENGQSDFLITTLARNGEFHERLHIRKSGSTVTRSGKDLLLPWQWSCEITRDQVGPDKRKHEVRVTKIPWQQDVFANGQLVPQP